MAATFFYLLSALAVASAIGVIAARSPLMSLLSLLVAFGSLAGVYLLAGFQFLAMAQLVVYAGAILVLFLYVIMLLNLDDVSRLKEQPARLLGQRGLVVAGAVAASLVLVGALVAGRSTVAAADAAATGTTGTTRVLENLDPLDEIAFVLFSRYSLAFEAVGLLLLATMIGVMVLAKRERGTQVGSDDLFPYAAPARPNAAALEEPKA